MICTKHLRYERIDRVVYILRNVGIGEVIKEEKSISPNGKVSYQCLTDTGVLLVVDETKTVCITMYVATQPKISALYKGNTPGWVIRMVKKNKKHAKLQNEMRY